MPPFTPTLLPLLFCFVACSRPGLDQADVVNAGLSHDQEAPTAGWIAGPPNQDCATACSHRGLACNEQELHVHNDEVDTSDKLLALISQVGGSTSATSCRGDWGEGRSVPSFTSDQCNPSLFRWKACGQCFYSAPGRSLSTFACDRVPGQHKQRLCYCSEAADTSEVAAEAEPSDTSEVAAGSGTVVFPFISTPEAGVVLPEGSVNIAQASVGFSLHCSQATTVQFKARVLALDGGSDSFRIQVKDGAKETWHLGSGQTWKWSNDSPAFNISEGSGSVTLWGREDGIKFKYLKLVQGSESCHFSQVPTAVVIVRDASSDNKKCAWGSKRAFKLGGGTAERQACIDACTQSSECVSMSGVFGKWCIGCKQQLTYAHTGAQSYKKAEVRKDEELPDRDGALPTPSLSIKDDDTFDAVLRASRARQARAIAKAGIAE